MESLSERRDHPEVAARRPEIYYVHNRQQMAAGVTPGPPFATTSPAALFERTSVRGQQYDVSPDGKRFLLMQKPENEPPLSVHVVENWFEEFRGKK